jgi:pimeloyl-ACP methyl ester carboxylesterase
MRCLPYVVLTALSLLVWAVSLRAEATLPGVVFVVGGIGGLDPLQYLAPLALPRAGVTHEIRVFAWTHGKLRMIRDLQDQCYLVAQGARLAELVRTYRKGFPGRPIYLVGHSAGAGVVLAAAEVLPPASLERIILLSAAVSPGYDLSGALRATRCEVVAFHFKGDLLFLDLGTRVFGTSDRVYSPAAGLDGFIEPDSLDAEGRRLYERLVQLPWRLEMFFESAPSGPHHLNCMPVFLARRVAPWLQP